MRWRIRSTRDFGKPRAWWLTFQKHLTDKLGDRWRQLVAPWGHWLMNEYHVPKKPELSRSVLEFSFRPKACVELKSTQTSSVKQQIGRLSRPPAGNCCWRNTRRTNTKHTKTDFKWGFWIWSFWSTGTPYSLLPVDLSTFVEPERLDALHYSIRAPMKSSSYRIN